MKKKTEKIMRKRNRGVRVVNHLTGKDDRGNGIQPTRLAQGQNGWIAGDTGRLFNDWNTTDTTIRTAIDRQVENIRARARELERNNPQVRRFVQLYMQNVIGPRGIQLQSKARRSVTGKNLDIQASNLIEADWRAWSVGHHSCVSGHFTFRQLLGLVTRRRIIDGEVFLEEVGGAKNPFNYALRVWESEMCPLHLNVPEKQIFQGVQVDNNYRPIAYFLRDETGEEILPKNKERYRRVPASRVIHYYKCERVNQLRGVPEIASAMERMHMLDGVVEAVLVGYRLGASKVAFIKDQEWSDPGINQIASEDNDGNEDGTAEASEQFGDLLLDVEPGSVPYIGDKELQTWDAGYPTANHADYVADLIRDMATAFSVPFHLLSGNTANINYSTARELKLDACDTWRTEQMDLVECVIDRVFQNWLRLQLISNRGGFARLGGSTSFARLADRRWQPRGWAWVDQEKEGRGNLLRLKTGSTTLSKIAAEQGENFEDNLDFLQIEDRKLRDVFGFGVREIVEVIADPVEQERD
jgi:lambda family phage portal protein